MKISKEGWRMIINVICTVLTAIGTALTTSSCITKFPLPLC